ncbi:MAG: motility protein MotB [Candidimonas sp.]|nr:MAG: motility protein MotB [Candidimonas sp.]
MAAEPEPRIVIHRPKSAHAEGHGGSWKIAYADFMTAMMAFFLVMWLLLLVPKESLQGIAQYFRTPLMSALEGKITDASPHNVIPGGSPSAIPNHAPTDAPPNAITHPSWSPGARQDQARLEDLKRRLEALIEANPVLKKYRPQLVLDMTPEGLRIQILDEQDKPMFALGSATLSPAMVDILHALAPTLNGVPNGLSIAGHTDAKPYVTGEQHYSNWELSADRANSARQALVAGGIDDAKVRRILGLADTMNLIKDDPMAAANRRISIVVLNKDADRLLRETYSGGAMTSVQWEKSQGAGAPRPGAAATGAKPDSTPEGAAPEAKPPAAPPAGKISAAPSAAPVEALGIRTARQLADAPVDTLWSSAPQFDIPAMASVPRPVRAASRKGKPRVRHGRKQ